MYKQTKCTTHSPWRWSRAGWSPFLLSGETPRARARPAPQWAAWLFNVHCRLITTAQTVECTLQEVKLKSRGPWSDGHSVPCGGWGVGGEWTDPSPTWSHLSRFQNWTLVFYQHTLIIDSVQFNTFSANIRFWTDKNWKVCVVTVSQLDMEHTLEQTKMYLYTDWGCKAATSHPRESRWNAGLLLWLMGPAASVLIWSGGAASLRDLGGSSFTFQPPLIWMEPRTPKRANNPLSYYITCAYLCSEKTKQTTRHCNIPEFLR